MARGRWRRWLPNALMWTSAVFSTEVVFGPVAQGGAGARLVRRASAEALRAFRPLR